MGYGYKNLVRAAAGRNAKEWVEELFKEAGYKVNQAGGMKVEGPYNVQLSEHLFGHYECEYEHMRDINGYGYRVEIFVGRSGTADFKTLLVEGSIECDGNRRYMILDKETDAIIWSDYEKDRAECKIDKFDPWGRHYKKRWCDDWLDGDGPKYSGRVWSCTR